jgi:hypothetical protein
MTMVRRYAIEFIIYGLLALGGVLLFLAQVNYAAAADLPGGALYSAPSVKDVPAYLPPRARAVRYYYAGVPLPDRRPDFSEEFSPAAPESGGTERRFALLRCAAFYALAATVMKNVRDLGYEDHAKLRRQAIAAMRESQSPGIKGPRWVDDSNDVFLQVYEEYVTSPLRNENLFDRYHETCERLVRPLLKREGS